MSTTSELVGNCRPPLPAAEEGGLQFPQRSKNARNSVSPQHFSGTARRREAITRRSCGSNPIPATMLCNQKRYGTGKPRSHNGFWVFSYPDFQVQAKRYFSLPGGLELPTNSSEGGTYAFFAIITFFVDKIAFLSFWCYNDWADGTKACLYRWLTIGKRMCKLSFANIVWI